MNRLLLLLLGTACLAADLHFAWNPNPPEEEVTAYFLRSSSNVAGPYSVVAAVTNGTQTNLTLSNFVPSRAFFYLTASNLWGESLPSNTITTPAPAKAATSLVLRVSK